MSVKIDNIGATSFTTATTGLLRSNPDPSSFATTCSQVKSYISSFIVVPLTTTSTLTIIGTWTKVLTNALFTQNTSSIQLRGSIINLGKDTTTVKVLGNTLNITSDYPTILSGVVNMARIQAGYVTTTVAGNTLIAPPIIPSGSTSVFVSPTINSIVGINGASGSGFTIATATPQEVNWFFFI